MRGLLLLALLGCTDPPQRPFVMPKNIEDLRARLLASIPEGRDIDGARTWMREHGFDCDSPLPSATQAHATVCRRGWTVVLLENNGRLADVLVQK